MADHPTAGRRTRLLTLVLLVPLGLGGCTTLAEYIHNGFKVGPNYHQPPVPVPPMWLDAGNPRVHIGDPNLCSWWDVFNDPILAKLLYQSFANNLTLRAAGVQILQAQEIRALACGQLFPQALSFNAQ